MRNKELKIKVYSRYSNINIKKKLIINILLWTCEFEVSVLLIFFVNQRETDKYLFVLNATILEGVKFQHARQWIIQYQH